MFDVDRSLQGNSVEQALQEYVLSWSIVSISMEAPLTRMPVFSRSFVRAREKVSGCMPKREAMRVLS